MWNACQVVFMSTPRALNAICMQSEITRGPCVHAPARLKMRLFNSNFKSILHVKSFQGQLN